MPIAMQYGSDNALNRLQTNSRSSIIYKGTIDDASVVKLHFEAGGLYELFTAEYTASTGAYRGHRSILIKAPEPELFGTTAVQRINESASTNSGITITTPTDSTVTLQRNGTAYAVKYVVRAVGTNIGNVSSAITAAESAAQAAQNYASEAEAAVEHYPKIENGYWYVWDVQTGTWMDTGVEARGISGITPNLTIGEVTTGQAGSQAEATITGTDEEPILNLTIPQGIAGGTQQDLLWTNPNPTANFAAQTISLDLSSYDSVGIITKLSATGTQYGPMQVFPIDDTKTFTLYIWSYTSANGGRNTIVKRNGIQFETGYYEGSTTNARAIPYLIYGIRGINATPSDNVPLQMKKLWENPSPTAAFAAQTVALDLSSYDMVGIEVLFYTTGATDQRRPSMQFFMRDNTFVDHLTITGRASNTVGGRLLTINENGIDFQSGMYNGSTSNNYAIPLRIYGIRGIT